MMLQAGHPCATEREYLPVMLVSTLSLLLMIAIDLAPGGGGGGGGCGWMCTTHLLSQQYVFHSVAVQSSKCCS